MANLIESTQWEASIYQIETTDNVVGGNDGISNRQGKQLANRTAYLKQQVELKAPIASPTFTGVPEVPTAAADTSTKQVASTAFVVGQAATAAPIIDGVATVGTSKKFARQDHVHPTDTTRAPVASPTFTGVPAAPTAAVDTSTTQVASTAFVIGQAATVAPVIDGVAAVGTSTKFARQDHVHPNDTTRAPVASPTFTGIPAAPTAGDGDNTSQVATTAFVQSAVGGYLSKAVTGGSVTLTDAEASNQVIALSGTLTANQILIVPTAVKRLWVIYNSTSGAFTLTVKTASGTGVTIAQGKRNLVYTDGTNVYDGFNDFESVDLTGTPTTPTAAADTSTTQVASTAFVIGQAATVAPVVDGVAAVGTSKKFARQDHVHPIDTTRAPIASPTFTGVPAVPTAAAGTNTTQVANTAFVATAIANLVDSSPGTLDTLNELAAALGDDPNFATTMTNALAGKAPLTSPTFTGVPAVPTAAVDTNTTQVASTAFVVGQAATVAPVVDGVAAVGTSKKFARQDHIHPTDTTRAPVASPTFTGIPAAPTAGDGDNSSRVATTAFVQSAVGGYLSKAVTGGSVTLTDAEASNPVIALSGTLTANQILIVPTAVKRLWAIYNSTSGAFTLTVKTASGTGVTIAQGKRNLVYTDGTNVYDGFNDFESVGLTGTPTTPTAAADTSTTQVASTAFVVGQAATVAPVVDGVAAVGTSKKFARQDHVHPTDTTRAPVASPTFTGVPAVPTAAVDTNTTQVASTAFVQAQIAAGNLASKTQNGYQKLQSGLIFQWGTVSLTQDDQISGFVIPYPNACFYIGPACFGFNEYAVGIATWDNSAFVIEGYSAGARAIKWMSIGY